ncbi:MAG: hydrolase [Rariglobus sp.]|jgi:8-oxo-dGTP pyrophosphatase MutT (NUDIX family)|nr:hydrolase [Rariglobus sp.]
MLKNDEELEIATGGGHWLTSWHQGPNAPSGRPHGSAGICSGDDDGVILISANGRTWDFPAGRPEKNESWLDTLHREMKEEACAVVDHAHLLGYCRGRCILGPEQGLVLVRAIWLAKVRLLDWEPQFEIHHRRIVPISGAIQETPSAYHAVWRRAFFEAKLG